MLQNPKRRSYERGTRKYSAREEATRGEDPTFAYLFAPPKDKLSGADTTNAPRLVRSRCSSPCFTSRPYLVDNDHRLDIGARARRRSKASQQTDAYTCNQERRWVPSACEVDSGLVLNLPCMPKVLYIPGFRFKASAMSRTSCSLHARRSSSDSNPYKATRQKTKPERTLLACRFTTLSLRRSTPEPRCHRKDHSNCSPRETPQAMPVRLRPQPSCASDLSKPVAMSQSTSSIGLHRKRVERSFETDA